jgi:hypothetical protein
MKKTTSCSKEKKMASFGAFVEDGISVQLQKNILYTIYELLDGHVINSNSPVKMICSCLLLRPSRFLQQQ